jgi:signal transduction histidine kinase
MFLEARTWLANAARFGDAETRRAALVTLAAQVTTVVMPVYFFGSWFTSPATPYVYALCACAWVAGGLALYALRAGRVQWAAGMLVGVMWLVVAGLVLPGGPSSPHVGAFAPAIVAVGLLLSPRLTIGATAASMVVVVVAYCLHAAGVFGAPPEIPPDLAAPLAQILATGGFVAGLIHAFSKTIEQLRASEAELRSSELRYQELFKHSPDGILLLSPEGEIQAANGAAAQCLRWGAEAERPKAFLELPFDPASRGLATQLCRGEVASGEVVLQEDSQPRVLAINATRLSRSGSYGGVQLSLRDATEARRAEAAQRHIEQRLRHADRMEAFGQLAGGVAHDFNNLLTIMFGQIELMRRHVAARTDASTMAQTLRQIERASERGAAITRQLLAFSRRSDDDEGEADVALATEECRSTVERLLREDIHLSLRIGPAGTAALSPLSLEQIVVNLAANACDAMPRGGRLVITTEEVEVTEAQSLREGTLVPGRYAVLRVSDTGTGMSKVVLEHAFEPFFTTKAPGQGTGLGLSSVHGIVSRAGGLMDVTSVIDEGTTFSIYLPQVEPSAVSPRMRSDRPARTRDHTVLICEDETVILNVMSEVLRRDGYVVRATSSPNEALALAKSLGSDLDLLITDVIMPEMNGRQLADALRSEHDGLPVLFMSGYTAGLLRDLGISESDERLLRKPFNPGALLSRVSAALEHTA